MDVKIVEWDQMILVGMSFYGDPFAESGGWTEENEIGRLWDRFMAYLTAHAAALRHTTEEQVAYEVHVAGEEAASKGFREVFVGVEVEHLADVPVELLVKVLPAATYAMFTLRGEEIASDWSMSIGQWMQENPAYASDATYGVQRYDERFRDVDHLAESVLEVFVPVKKVDDAPPGGDR